MDHDPEATFDADKMLREQKDLINVYNESIEKQQESLRLRKQQLIEEGKGAKLKKEEMAFFKAEESVLSFFDKTKAKATELQSQFKEIDLSALAKSDSPYELLKNLTSISEQIAKMGDKVKSSPVAQWIEQSRVETERLKEEYLLAWRANEDLKKHSARYSSEMDEPLIKIHETLDKRTSAETQVKLIEDIKKEEQELLNYQQQLAQAQQQSTAATEQQTQATEARAEVEKQYEEAQKQHKASQEQLNKEREKSAKLQGEAIEQDNKAAAAEGKVADATSKATEAQAKFNKKMEEGLQDVKNMENAQTDMQIKLDGQEQQLKENSEAYSKNAQDTAKAEADKRRAQGLTMKQLETIIALYKKQHDEELEANTDAWREKGAEIERLTKILNEWKGEAKLQMMTERIGNIGNLSNAAFEETKKFWQAMADGADKTDPKLKTIEGNLKVIAEEERQRTEAKASKLGDDLTQMTEQEIRESIDAANQLVLAYGRGSDKAKELAQQIVNAEEHIKRYDVEAERNARKQAEAINDMREQLKKGTSLSDSALTAQKNFWQRLIDDPKTATASLKEYQAELDRTEALQKEKAIATRDKRADRLEDDLKLYTASEIREGIEATQQLMLNYDKGSEKAKELAQRIVDAEEHIKLYDLEAERDARRQAESIAEMRKQLELGTELSETALKAQQNYWQKLADDPKTAIEKVKEYQAEVERVKDLIKEQDIARRDERASWLSGDLTTMDEQKIRQAIEAGNQLILTYEKGSDEAKELATKIVNAEEHVRKYDVEAERAARRQQEAVEQMQKQLEQGTSLTHSALKAQKNFWQKLIDDPKTAKEKVAEYVAELERVKKITAEKTASDGEAALAFFRGSRETATDEEQRKFRNATAADVKEQADALKAYRDSLPREDKADVIAEINEYLGKTGQAAKTATEELMDFEKAKELALQAGDDVYGKNNPAFLASPEEIQAATKSIEKYREELFKTIKQKKDMGEATDDEEAELQELAKYLKDLKFEQDNFNMSREKMEQLMATPVNATSIDELRAAIKRADGELKRMEGSLGENSKEYQEFAGQVKNAKNVLKEMEGQAKATASAWDKAWSRLKTYVGMYMGFNIVWSKFTATGGDLMDLSDKMGEVRKTTGFTADEVGKLSDNLAKLDTRTSLTGLMEFSSLAGSIGMKTQEQVQGFTEAANMLAVSLPEMGNEASRTLMKIADATGDLEKNGGNVRETLERVGSTIIALRANSAAAAGPITDFVSRVGAVGAQAGISIDKIAALGATVDALGGRVEMSATALSRMIPAIRNNTFEVAKAIGMTEKELKGKTAMEQMVAIFKALRDSAKGFDTSTEEGMNAMADSVEKALGRSASMQEVMKELNQQGARAGIVFGLLSQNVDKLEEQLETAGEAYQKNTALMDEYNKMNDTTAAKWAKLKNQFEEFFVGDKTQRFLGWLIDGFRKIIDLITDEGPLARGLRYLAIYATMVKAAWAEAIGSMIISLGKYVWSMRESTIATEADTAAKVQNYTVTTTLGTATEGAAEKTNLFARAWGKLNNAMKANIITAIGTALIWLATTLWDAHKAAKEVAEAINRVKEKTDEEREAVSKLFNPLKKANLEEAEKKRLITEINSKYGSYLSKMLTEASNAQEIARAYEAINLQLERKNTLEGINTNKKRVLEQNKDVLDSSFNEMDNAVQKAFKKGTDASRISSYISGAVKDAIEQGLSADQMARQIESALKKEVGAGKMKEYIQIISGGTSRREDASSYIANAARRYYNTQMQVQSEVNTANKRLQADLDNVVKQVRDAAEKDVPTLVKGLNDALSKGTDVKKYTAKESSAVVEAFNAVKSYYDLHREDLTDAQKNKLLKVMGTDISAFQTKANAGGGGGGNGGSNPYGDYNKVTSPYSDWNGDDLVARRKEMLERVRALANGADVQAVLSEDAKFISEATRKNIKDTKQAIEWYNTERLKIQEALHAKHLTNTGDWMDPPKQKARKKMLHDETRTYLDELDAYYTERKAKIQEAAVEEGISEAEVKNRTLANEAEWRQRRMELQKMYGEKAKDVTEEEQEAIFEIIADRTGDSVEMVKTMYQSTLNFVKQIEKMNEQGAKEAHEFRAKMDKQAMQDFNREQAAIHQQMKAIQDIIDKERPFNGITKNLRENLVTMGILTADMTAERNKLMKENADMTDFNARQAEAELKRTAFILGEAENAWTTSVEEIMKRMADAGMTAWADEIRKSPKMQEALIAQLHNTYDQIQEAIKKEASLMKKQAENMWNNILLPGGDGKTTVKDAFEKAIAQLGLDQGRVSRANSLINAGPASERVADKLAIKQMKLQLTMQTHYFNLMKKQGLQRIQDLERQADLLEKQGKLEEASRVRQDKTHAEMSLRLATTKEQTTLLKQQEEIIAKTEESQNRLYKELKEWADLLASSMQSLFEASNAGNAEYYNERARIALEGEAKDDDGKVKVERYVVIEDAGTSDAEAHYEELTELQKIEREREIEQQNAQAEAWKKVMDDINMKMSETITDYMNSFLQNEYIDKNTQALYQNTMAIDGLIAAMGGKASNDFTDAGSMARDKSGMALDDSGNIVYPIQPTEGEEAAKPLFPTSPEDWEMTREQMGETFQLAGEKMLETNEMLNEAGVKPLFPQPMTDDEVAKIIDNNALITEAMTEQTINAGQTLQESGIESINPKILSDEEMQAINDQVVQMSQVKIDTSNKETAAIGNNAKKQTKEVTSANNQTANSTQSTFAKMAAAANMYGIAYQTMSNDNLSTAQKVEMFALQAAGQAAIAMLTTDMIATEGKTTVQMPGIFGKLMGEMPYWAALAAYAGITATMGGLMALAMSSVSKSKSQIAQATGASTSSNAKSISAGKLMTGMLTYGEGNVNEFTDPSSLTPGRSYNVDSADGRTYRAKYMGTDPKTHLTNGPEFHLVGERGREAIIDAHTTRLMQMDDTGIWQAIQTLYNGGSLRHSVMRRKGRGMAAFADGNIDEFETMADGGGLMAGGAGFSPEQMMALQASIDRQSDLLERAMTDGIHAYFDVYGRGGLIDSYDTGKKTVTSHGERY